MPTIWLDVRYGLRQLRRSPGFAVSAIVTLALGIGAAAAVFTVVHRVLLQPLPYPEPQRLVRLWDRNEAAGLPYFSVSPANYFAWREASRTLEALGAYREDGFTLRTAEGGERIEGARVTFTLLDVLGVRPAAGRGIAADDDRPGAPRVALVSAEFARRLAGPATGSPLGRTVTLDGQPHAIVGVLPRDFHFPQQPQVELLVPYALNSAAPEAGGHFLRVLGRLSRTADLARARTEFAAMAASRETQTPQFNRGWTVAIESLHETIVGDVEQPLRLLLGAAGLLLLVTCANVAGLFLARSASRDAELAVRAAFGAGAGRIGRQLITESLVLSGIGGIAGLALGRWALDLLLAINPEALPRTAEIAVDARVLIFVGAICTVTGIVFGTLPSLLRARTFSIRDALAGSARIVGAQGAGLRRGLVAGEIALALAITITSVLLVKHLLMLQRIEPGFARSGVLTMALQPPAGTFSSPADRAGLYRRVVEALEALPGAGAVGAAHRLPMDGNSAWPFEIIGQGGREGPPPSINYRAIAGRYFDAMGMRVVAGRFFSDAEMWDSPGAAIVNRAAVEKYFGSLDPLAQQIWGPGKRTLRIVGVVEDVREDSLDEPAAPALYLPYTVAPVPGLTFVMASSTPPAGLARAAQQAVRQIDPSLALAKIRPMQQYLDETVAAPRFNATLLTVFAVIAMVLAAVGIYGLTAVSVAERRRELGVRLALGARPSQVMRGVALPGLALAAAGTVAGALGAYAAARLLGGFVLGVDAYQPSIYLGTSLALFAVAGLATLIPARRAMRVDPLVTLRAER
jgi:predicted permease